MINTVAAINVVCALVSAKWAKDLGFNQVRQLIFLVGGLILGPIMLLILYVRLLYKSKAEGKPSGKVF